ncbi:MAG: DUF2188 domain-containing protein [Candidatus Tectomicrobia bacterium]|nr:DUF2188 domain-containing protein [Candidatus Tectomicrobia bacterium]
MAGAAADTGTKCPATTWGGSCASTGPESHPRRHLHRTQRDAEAAARDMLRKQGGGELTTAGRDGRFLRSATTNPRKAIAY